MLKKLTDKNFFSENEVEFGLLISGFSMAFMALFAQISFVKSKNIFKIIFSALLGILFGFALGCFKLVFKNN